MSFLRRRRNGVSESGSPVHPVHDPGLAASPTRPAVDSGGLFGTVRVDLFDAPGEDQGRSGDRGIDGGV
jgi:hypothetical protein